MKSCNLYNVTTGIPDTISGIFFGGTIITGINIISDLFGVNYSLTFLYGRDTANKSLKMAK